MPLAIAIAAIIASYARAEVLRPARLSEADTRPNARAASASNTSGSKSDSACRRCAWRAACYRDPWATKGPTASSASVMQEITGSAGRSEGSESLGSRSRVLVLQGVGRGG